MDQEPIQPQTPRRLVRSSRDRMWAGVCGGLGEYFDVDPVLVRLIFVAATVVSGGLGIPIYFVLWLVMPRDDRPDQTYANFQGWSQEFRSETRRFAEDAGRMARDVTGEARGSGSASSTDAGTATETSDWVSVPENGTTSGYGTPSEGAASGKGYGRTSAPPPFPEWPTYTRAPYEPHRSARRQQAAGVILVAMGAIFLLNQFLPHLVNWHLLWPLILVGVGVALLARRSDWRF